MVMIAGGAAAVAGGVAKGLAGKKTKTTTNQTVEPYKPTQPYLTDILGKAQAIQENPNAGKWGPSAVAPLSSTTTSGINKVKTAAANPTGLIPQAQNKLGQTISGGMLTAAPGNPTLAQFATGQNQNTVNANPYTSGFADPSQGFQSNLMQNGFSNPAAQMYGDIAGMTAGDNSSGLFSQAAGAQAGQGATDLYGQLAGTQAGQGAMANYQNIAGMTAGQGGTDLYGQLGGMTAGPGATQNYQDIAAMQAGPGATQNYQDISGMRANTDALAAYQGVAGMQANPAATGVYNDLASGNFNQGAGYYEQLANRQYSDPNNQAMADYLTPFANGSLSSVDSNPYLQQMLDIQSRRISDSVNSMFGAGNRYGSGANQGVLGREIGDAATSMLGSAYETNMNRQLSAAGNLASIGENRASRDLSSMATGAAGLESMRNANLGYNLAGAQGLTQQAQFADQFNRDNALAGAQGMQSVNQFADQYNLGAAQAGAAGLAQQSQFADQFGLSAAQAGAQGLAQQSQFADQFAAQNVGNAAAGIQNQGQFRDQFGLNAATTGAQGIAQQSQFGDQFNASNLAQGAAGIQNQGQFADQFNQNALLSGAAGLQANQQFGDSFGFNAAQVGAGGINNNALAQIQAQTGAAGALTNTSQNQAATGLSALGLNASVMDNNLNRQAGAATGLNEAFQNERLNQLNAINNSVPLDQARYLDAQQLIQAGQVQDANAQARAAEANAKFQYENTAAPWGNLNNYANIVGGIAGLGQQSNGTAVTKQGGGLLNGIAGGIGALGSVMGGGFSGAASTGMSPMGLGSMSTMGQYGGVQMPSFSGYTNPIMQVRY